MLHALTLASVVYAGNENIGAASLLAGLSMPSTKDRMQRRGAPKSCGNCCAMQLAHYYTSGAGEVVCSLKLPGQPSFAPEVRDPIMYNKLTQCRGYRKRALHYVQIWLEKQSRACSLAASLAASVALLLALRLNRCPRCRQQLLQQIWLRHVCLIRDFHARKCGRQTQWNFRRRWL
jgi:hypothetical protein